MGKTWRRNIASPSHVQNWPRWQECGLPTSATTIDRDMRDGIPEERIALYALCLGLTTAELCSPAANRTKKPAPTAAPAPYEGPPIPTASLPRYSTRFQCNNEPAYIRKLFAFMGGVYRMDYLLQGIDLIHRCTLWIYAAEENHLRMRGRFIMFGKENPLEAIIFRWHNNLHTHFLCENGTELGYTLSVDPLRYEKVRQRKPFWILGTGMTDRGLEDHRPITFNYRMNQLPVPRGMSVEQLWRREDKDMEKRPFLSPSEESYETIWTNIQTPDELL